MEIDKFCCVCVEFDKELENVQSKDGNNIEYSEKLSLCDPSQLWLDQDFYICKECIEKLNLVYEFIMCCKKSKDLREQQLIKFQEEIEQKLNIEELVICDICKKSFKQKRYLKLHITRVHLKTSKNKRNKVQGKDNGTTTEAYDLKEDKIDINDVTHGLSNNVFEDENDDSGHNAFSEHYDSDPDPEYKHKLKRKKYRQKQESFTCSYCGKLFNRRQHWSAHIRSIHTFEKPYKCNLCEASFSNSHSLLVHNRNHRNEKPCICSTCGKGFVCSGDLNHHNKIHLNKREYQCNICDKGFNTASILRTHRIVKHTDPKDWKYGCTVCNRRFPLNSGLAVHMKRHKGVREYSCNVCEKQFFNKSEVTKHFLTHSDERHFTCMYCGEKEYKSKEAFNKHLKMVHDIGTWKKPKLEKKFLCPICPKLFLFNNKLQRHILSHTGEKPYKCEYCEKQFYDNYYRKVHLKKDHNLDI